jgi:hypothetical protein
MPSKKMSAKREENIRAEIARIEKQAERHVAQGGNPDNVWRDRVNQLKAMLPEPAKEIEDNG